MPAARGKQALLLCKCSISISMPITVSVMHLHQLNHFTSGTQYMYLSTKDFSRLVSNTEEDK